MKHDNKFQFEKKKPKMLTEQTIAPYTRRTKKWNSGKKVI